MSIECPVCKVERDLESYTLTRHPTAGSVCDFCQEAGAKAPEPPQEPKKRGRKPKVPPDPVRPVESPPEAPKSTPKSTDLISDEAAAQPYAAPAFDEQAARTNPDKEVAARELCRRRLMPFVQRFRPKYLPGWVHKDICRRLERFVEKVEAGEEPRLLLMLPPRGGKQLADETLVPTPSGWRHHGDLKAGDEVFHPSGRPVRVLAVSKKTPSTVKVTFSDGASYFCHENHEWTLYNRMRREWQTIETNHFLKPTRFGKAKQVTTGDRCMYQLPVAEPLQYANTEFLAHPYVLGAWLGDGSAGKPCITGAKSDKAIIDRVVELGYPISTVCEHQTTGVLTTYFSGDGVADAGLVPKRRGPIPGRLSQELEALGVFRDKHIPDAYKRLTVDLRLQLLAGLIDTDGDADKNGRLTFTTASRRLADDVLELVSGLGFRPYVQEVEPRLSSSGIQGRKVYWRVGFQPTMAVPTVLARKTVTRFAKQRRVGLVSVERVGGDRQGHCIQVDSPDGLYVVGEKLTVTHNSEISSRHFPAWVLGKHPEWEIIAASHTGSLTLSFSRYIRDLLRDPAYNVVFPNTHLDPSSQSVENWNLMEGGGYLAAGVGTGITGRGCLAPYTLVDTNRGKMRIIDLKVGDSVYGYDHEHKEVVTTRVKAVQVTERSKHLLDFGKIRLTTDHRIYNASRGFYTRAGESPSLLGLRRKEGASCCDLQGVLFEGADGSDHIAQMRLLWEELHAQRCGAPKVTGSTRSGCEGVLRSSLLRHVQNQQPGGVQQGEGRVPALQKACDWNGSFEVLQQGLLQRVQGFETADGCLQWRVSDAKEACIGARQEVLALRNDKLSVRCASHQSGRDGQPDFESGAALHGVPPQISSVHGTCAADIAKLFESFDFVVDIQTETGNFFTEGLLVHNCHILILDDLVKDQEAADSPTIRENTWEWYISTAHSRLAPGGGVLGVMTWWSEDDWAGRIQETMKGDGEKFEIVRYPAINDEGDEYILPDDSIEQIPPGSPVPEGSVMTRPMNSALHPERYDLKSLLKKKLNYMAAGMVRMWNALYQQNPTPDSGIMFTKDLFRRYVHPPSRRGRLIYQAWDFAITEKTASDWTVCATIMQDEFDNLYVLDVFRFKSGDGNAIVEHMIDQYVLWDADYLGMEDGQIWKTMQSQFEKRCKERKVYPSTQILVPLTDKLVRANPIKGRMQLGKVYFPEEGSRPWVDVCVREMIVFPNGKHDDQVDALAWAVRMTLDRPPPKDPTPKTKAPESWKTKLNRMLNGQGGGHMSA